VLLKGPVKHSICEYVEATKPDVLVMSSRGLGSVKRWLLGSTSDHCVHHCQCPVFIIKAEPTEEAGAKKD
jgi:nucleotide-binding universal stress UspA family protein